MKTRTANYADKSTRLCRFLKRTTGIFFFFIILFSVFCSLYSAAQADIPHLINYQGKLTDKDGKPMEGTKSITFRIYDVELGGSPLSEETQSVTIAAANKGIFKE